MLGNALVAAGCGYYATTVDSDGEGNTTYRVVPSPDNTNINPPPGQPPGSPPNPFPSGRGGGFIPPLDEAPCGDCGGGGITSVAENVSATEGMPIPEAEGLHFNGYVFIREVVALNLKIDPESSDDLLGSFWYTFFELPDVTDSAVFPGTAGQPFQDFFDHVVTSSLDYTAYGETVQTVSYERMDVYWESGDIVVKIRTVAIDPNDGSESTVSVDGVARISQFADRIEVEVYEGDESTLLSTHTYTPLSGYSDGNGITADNGIEIVSELGSSISKKRVYATFDLTSTPEDVTDPIDGHLYTLYDVSGAAWQRTEYYLGGGLHRVEEESLDLEDDAEPIANPNTNNAPGMMVSYAKEYEVVGGVEVLTKEVIRSYDLYQPADLLNDNSNKDVYAALVEESVNGEVTTHSFETGTGVTGDPLSIRHVDSVFSEGKKLTNYHDDSYNWDIVVYRAETWKDGDSGGAAPSMADGRVEVLENDHIDEMSMVEGVFLRTVDGIYEMCGPYPAGEQLYSGGHSGPQVGSYAFPDSNDDLVYLYNNDLGIAELVTEQLNDVDSPEGFAPDYQEEKQITASYIDGTHQRFSYQFVTQGGGGPEDWPEDTSSGPFQYYMEETYTHVDSSYNDVIGKTVRERNVYTISFDSGSYSRVAIVHTSELLLVATDTWEQEPGSSDTYVHYNEDSQQIETYFHNGVIQSQAIRVSDNHIVTTNLDGSVTTELYDEETRIRTVTISYPGSGMPDVVTTTVEEPGYFEFDANLPVTKTTTTRAVGQMVTVSERIVDWAGQVLWTLDESGIERSYLYSTYSQENQGQVAYQGRAVQEYRGNVHDLAAVSELLQTIAYYTDGRLKAIYGPAVSDSFYDYETDSATGCLVTLRYEGCLISDNGQGGITVTGGRVYETYVDGAGRTVRVERSAADQQGGVITESYAYQVILDGIYEYETDEVSKVSSSDPYQAVQLYQPDGFGGQLSGLDIDGNDALEGVGSADRFSRSFGTVFTDAGQYWSGYRTEIWLDGTTSRITTLSDRIDLSATSLDAYPRLVRGSKSEILTSGGQLGATVTREERIDAPGKMRVSTMSSDGTGIEEAVMVAGYPVSRTSALSSTPETWSYEFTASGIITTHTNAAGGVVVTTSDTTGRPLSVEDKHTGLVTNYSYHPVGTNGEGQVSQVWGSQGTINYTYNVAGQLTGVSGDTYQLAYTYTEEGHIETLTTYGTQTAVTKWEYDAASGVLLHKYYDWQEGMTNTPAISYTYYAGGQLKDRLWKRDDGSGNRVTSAYGYSPAGDLIGISYSNDGGTTPDITLSGHDRLGQPTSVSLAGGGMNHSATLSWDSLTGESSGEAYGGTLLPELSLSRSWVGQNAPGAQLTTTLTNDAVSDLSRTLTRAQSSSQQLASLAAGGVTTTFHNYHPGTAMWTEASLGSVRHVRTLDASVRNTGFATRQGVTPSGSMLTFAGYQYNAEGHQSVLTREDGTRWEYGYNSKGEVTSGKKHFVATGNFHSGRQFEYDYDGIGNRTIAKYGGNASGGDLRTITYIPDAENQYDGGVLTHPGYASILGDGIGTVTLGTDTTVGVSQIQTANHTDDWWLEVQGRGWVNLDVEIDGNDFEQGHLWIPPAAFTPVYDADGNLEDDGRWVYTWNAENRLIAMDPSSAAVGLDGDPPMLRLRFAYDWLGRRIQKVSWLDANNNGIFDLSETGTDKRFVYDGWNLIGEYEEEDTNDSNALTRKATYLWGPDLSATEQGAGGVGGLLVVNLYTGTSGSQAVSHYYPSYDGNGNIISWLDHSGSVVQSNDYDPFGNLISRRGEIEGLNYGFSTKYTDIETGLCYYGYRYYQPEHGRWLNRDPIQENGGDNLYGFVKNNGINFIDYLGQDFIAVGDRQVNGAHGIPGFWHMSVDFFTENPACTVKGHRFFRTGSTFRGTTRKGIPAGAVHSKSVELLNTRGLFGRYKGRHKRTFLTVSVSRIEYDQLRAVDWIVIYSDADNGGKVKETAEEAWKRILAAAEAYDYAEHDLLPVTPASKLSNWPNSEYGYYGNNSNTFVRVMARLVGGDADSMPRQHIGAQYPSPVPNSGTIPVPRRP